MLFQSQIFLLVFLPLTVGGYYLAARHADRIGDNTRKWLLIVASLWFYGYWDPRLLPLLLFSILANCGFAKLYPTHGRYLLALGVVLNLVLLGIFKYADFFANTVALEKLRPMRFAAVTAGLGLIAVLVRVSAGRDVELIYFQF